MGEQRRWARLGGFVLVGGLAVVFGCLLLLLLTGRTGVNYSADHDGTLPLWLLVVPALLGIALTRVFPPRLRWENPFGRHLERTRRESAWLVVLAVLFAVAMVVQESPLVFLIAKPLLLVVIPLVLFAVNRRGGAPREKWQPLGTARLLAPVLPVAVFLALTYLIGVYPDSTTIPPWDVIVAVFLFNAVFEELFYRRWLQSRLEAVLGMWPAIVLAALLWAVWHVGIMSHHGLGLGILTVLAGHGIRGLFLGYLWARYRNFSALLLTHGVINAPFVLTGLV
ncbi:membrane protease YdiL (CAAX protease family) [Crossiella equi]|uniref:Membrane protease YdiL (CAAX protease family) n=1 Tax=Crossiella equi TaxID=130796 RepID=A0ABS5AQH9_9PSEU|nr:CPBP family intramembrane glutamic endopeptidase [Crossiella equi]MBP2478822.1 membrane protease YdiL (CAAX protease family) [Crossiella equi]